MLKREAVRGRYGSTSLDRTAQRVNGSRAIASQCGQLRSAGKPEERIAVN